MEELNQLRNIVVKDSDYVEPYDVLLINDTKKFPELRDFAFAWLSPDGRRKSGHGMGHWRWVNGELARLVRASGIAREAIGGDSITSVIQNGDLILAFMPKKLHEAREHYMQKKNSEALQLVKRQDIGQGPVGSHQTQKSETRIHQTYEGHTFKEE
jgi:hypothetical protein